MRLRFSLGAKAGPCSPVIPARSTNDAPHGQIPPDFAAGSGSGENSPAGALLARFLPSRGTCVSHQPWLFTRYKVEARAPAVRSRGRRGERRYFTH